MDRTVIRNSTITNANLWGLALVGSRPRLHDNYFGSSNGKGIYAITASAPKLVYSDSSDGNNRFENVKYSIYSLNSQPILGKASSSEYFGNNCFTGDELSLWAINETPKLDYEIEAYGNDRGESEPESINELTSDLLTIRNITGLFNSTTMLLMNIDTDNFINYKKDIFTGSSGKMQQGTGEDEIIMTAFNLLVEEKYKASNIADSAGVIIPMLNFLNNNYPTSAYTEQANLLYSTDIPENSMSLNAPGKGGTVATTENEENLFQYKLYNNYPNPFNPTTKIKYTLTTTGEVTLSIISVSGELLEKRELGEISPGSYEEEINLRSKNAASGVYFAEITLKTGSEVKKERVKLQLLK